MSAIAGPDRPGAMPGPASHGATQDPAERSARGFEEWVQQTRARFESAKRAPDALREALQRRCAAGLYTTDTAVLDCVNAWVFFEMNGQDEATRELPAHQRFRATFALIDALAPCLYGRPALQARLHERKAVLLRLGGPLDDCIGELETALALLEPVRLDVDRRRLSALVELGGARHATSDRGGAEAAYLEVLSYPWYSVDDAEAAHALRHLYLAAGRGLIEARRGDLAKLREIVFVPAAMQELGPRLQRAIREATR